MPAIVSVIIPVYNQAEYIGQAIESALAQTFPKVEILVVNDGSTDQTAHVLAHYAQDIQLITQENAGLCAARNRALHEATGRYIAFLDADDLWYSEKLTDSVTYLEQHPEIDIVVGAWDWINEDGILIRPLFTPSTSYQKLLTDPIQELILWGSLFHIAALCFRKECFDRVGAFDTDLQPMSDWDLWLRIAKEGFRFGFIDAPVSRYRRHQKNMTFNLQWMESDFHKVLEKCYADHDIATRLSHLKTYAYIYQWLILAKYAHEAKLPEDLMRCLREAESLYMQTARNEEFIQEHILMCLALAKECQDVVTARQQCLRLASWLYLTVPHDERFCRECLLLLDHVVGAENLCQTIITVTPTLSPLDQWNIARKFFHQRQYQTTFMVLLYLFKKRPRWFMQHSIWTILRKSRCIISHSKLQN